MSVSFYKLKCKQYFNWFISKVLVYTWGRTIYQLKNVDFECGVISHFLFCHWLITTGFQNMSLHKNPNTIVHFSLTFICKSKLQMKNRVHLIQQLLEICALISISSVHSTDFNSMQLEIQWNDCVLCSAMFCACSTLFHSHFSAFVCAIRMFYSHSWMHVCVNANSRPCFKTRSNSAVFLFPRKSNTCFTNTINLFSKYSLFNLCVNQNLFINSELNAVTWFTISQYFTFLFKMHQSIQFLSQSKNSGFNKKKIKKLAYEFR